MLNLYNQSVCAIYRSLRYALSNRSQIFPLSCTAFWALLSAIASSSTSSDLSSAVAVRFFNSYPALGRNLQPIWSTSGRRPKGKGSPGTAVSLVLSVIGFLIQLGAFHKRIFHPWASLPLISDSTFPALGWIEPLVEGASIPLWLKTRNLVLLFSPFFIALQPLLLVSSQRFNLGLKGQRVHDPRNHIHPWAYEPPSSSVKIPVTSLVEGRGLASGFSSKRIAFQARRDLQSK